MHADGVEGVESRNALLRRFVTRQTIDFRLDTKKKWFLDVKERKHIRPGMATQ